MTMYKSAQGELYKALRRRLLRDGIPVGETAEYPRIEIHSFTENPPQDKDGYMRTVSCIVESMSEDRMADVLSMNEGNLDLLRKALSLDTSWRIIDIIPGQLQEMTESTETNKILYRLLQNITVYVERLTE